MRRLPSAVLWTLETLVMLVVGVAVFVASYAGLSEWRPELRQPPQAYLAAAGAVLLGVAASVLLSVLIAQTRRFLRAVLPHHPPTEERPG